MRRAALLFCIAGLSAGLSACASPPDTLSALPPQEKQAFMKGGANAPLAGAEAPAPSGYLAFCERNPGECRVRPGQPAVIALTDDVRATLKEINFVVNNAIRPVEDSDHYGKQEFWTVPVDGEGDCEDYVLAKRKMLTLLGMPAAALRITVVLRGGVRHAVLTAVTDQGDLVLDNMQDDVLPSDQVNYVWVERQEVASRSGWVALNAPR